MYVTIEETRNKEIWVDADDFDEAIEIVNGIYRDGGIDMRCGSEVHALVGDNDHEFYEMAVWYC